jgi:hypothetical protein
MPCSRTLSLHRVLTPPPVSSHTDRVLASMPHADAAHSPHPRVYHLRHCSGSSSSSSSDSEDDARRGKAPRRTAADAEADKGSPDQRVEGDDVDAEFKVAADDSSVAAASTDAAARSRSGRGDENSGEGGGSSKDARGEDRDEGRRHHDDSDRGGGKGEGSGEHRGERGRGGGETQLVERDPRAEARARGSKRDTTIEDSSKRSGGKHSLHSLTPSHCALTHTTTPLCTHCAPNARTLACGLLAVRSLASSAPSAPPPPPPPPPHTYTHTHTHTHTVCAHAAVSCQSTYRKHARPHTHTFARRWCIYSASAPSCDAGRACGRQVVGEVPTLVSRTI